MFTSQEIMQTQIQVEELFEVEKQVKYRSTARVQLERLQFKESRELDKKNLERLKANFRKDCRRLDRRNHIPALIDQQLLDAAIRASGISAEMLMSNQGFPEMNLPAGYNLECLHGRHRIQAGKETLSGRDQWWTVNFYLAGIFKAFPLQEPPNIDLDINKELRTCLIEEYSNEAKPADGEIYRKIRQYHFEKNTSFEKRWWTRLTPHGAKNLKQLLRHDEFTAAFDPLLEIPGLWAGMRISTIHKMMAIKCDEVSRAQHIIRSAAYF